MLIGFVFVILALSFISRVTATQEGTTNQNCGTESYIIPCREAWSYLKTRHQKQVRSIENYKDSKLNEEKRGRSDGIDDISFLPHLCKLASRLCCVDKDYMKKKMMKKHGDKEVEEMSVVTKRSFRDFWEQMFSIISNYSTKKKFMNIDGHEE